MSNLTQSVDVSAGKSYVVSFEVIGYTGGSVTVSIGGTAGTARTANGTYTQTLVATNTNALSFAATPDFNGSSIDNVSVVAIKLDLVTGITAGLARAYGTDVGDSVSLWLDRSSEGNDLAQTSIVSQPMLVEVDGVNWLRFDGVDDALNVAIPFADTNGESWTVSFVAKPNTLSGSVTTNPIFGGVASFISLTSSLVTVRLNGSGNEGASSIAITASEMVIVIIRTPTTLQAFVNGVAGSVATVTSDHRAEGISLVGQRFPSGGGNFAGQIGEIIITNRAITTTERQRIERSLAAKYGITLA
jgi:hypothetical protein